MKQNLLRPLMGLCTSIVLVAGFSLPALARDITLFDSQGEAVAYLSTDEDLTVYLWEGKPVAYLAGNSQSLYGFNGKHLGWLVDGIVRDHRGFAVGFIRGAVSMVTSIEPLKSLKELKPLKSLKELSPMLPMFQDSWSRYPLDLFLAQGSDE